MDSDAYRGNKEVFLACIAGSPEFREIIDKHLSGRNLWLEHLTRNPDIDFGNKTAIDACASEISQLFQLKMDVARNLVVTADISKNRDLHQPRIIQSPDGNSLYVEIKPETTKADYVNMWGAIRKIKPRSTCGKKSINPELAYCIHRQLVIGKRHMHDIFLDYIDGKLAGYDHKPTITDENDFAKYYRRVVKGVQID